MPLKIHHLNCGSLCPMCARLVNGEGGWLERGQMICHCLLIESESGLILVDTGLGMGDIAQPQRFPLLFRLSANPALRRDETAIEQVRRLGFQPQDVRHICLTHLDLDHAGGINDFPHAKVHVHRREYEGIDHARHAWRYVREQWSNDTQWVLHDTQGDAWHGFDSVRLIDSQETEVLLIPLFGHSNGHCGVAVRDSQGWLLHAGDAFFHHRQMQVENPHAPLAVGLFQRNADEDRKARKANQERVRQLANNAAASVRVINSHDPHFFIQAVLRPTPSTC